VAALIGLVWIGLPATAAHGAPSNSCTVGDRRISRIEGLVALSGGGYAATFDQSRIGGRASVFFLDNTCRIIPSRTLTTPFETTQLKNLALTPDGAFWIGNVGGPPSATLSAYKLDTNGARTVQWMRLGSGKGRSESFLVQDGNIPVVIARTSSGQSVVYRGVDRLVGRPRTRAQPLLLQAVGPVKIAGGQVVVSAAASPDRKRVAIRTSTDAYEWDVADGDYVSALTTGVPRRTPLAGRAPAARDGLIAYRADGNGYLVSSAAVPASISAIRREQPTPVAHADAAWERRDHQGNGGLAALVVVILALVLGGAAAVAYLLRRQRVAATSSLDEDTVVVPTLPVSEHS
jgi:dipeptidyl aminopeptidase/acylaminoacyl peptidase